MADTYFGVPLKINYTKHKAVNGTKYGCELYFGCEFADGDMIETKQDLVVTVAETRQKAFSVALAAMEDYVDQKNAENAQEANQSDE